MDGLRVGLLVLVPPTSSTRHWSKRGPVPFHLYEEVPARGAARGDATLVGTPASSRRPRHGSAWSAVAARHRGRGDVPHLRGTAGLAFSPQAERERRFIRAPDRPRARPRPRSRTRWWPSSAPTCWRFRDTHDSGFNWARIWCRSLPAGRRRRALSSGCGAGAAGPRPATDRPRPSLSAAQAPPRAGHLPLRHLAWPSALSDTTTPSIFLAFAAGLVSFISPCVLPLVPGYLSTVCGLSRRRAARLERIGAARSARPRGPVRPHLLRHLHPARA